ncbi:MAG: ATP-binding protein, partial [Spirulinaceae cyanobacterium]
VKDSHDRHANVEVSFLLQRMEAYQGLAILTTNLKDSLDQAFLRRLRFVVSFPFPDAESRSKIWQRMYPQQTPTKALDYYKLGQLAMTGGSIRNIALNAAFLAAETEGAVMMENILAATRAEAMKIERILSDRETAGWILKTYL